MIYILAISHEYNHLLEKKYVVLDKLDYRIDNDINKLDTISKEKAKTLIKNYVNSVTICDSTQMDSSFKYSRFYSITEINKFLVQNTYNKRSDAYIVLHHAYISNKSDSLIFNCFKDSLPADIKLTDYIGWTSMLELYIDGKSVRNQISCENYKGALLEIGKPCPPRCDGSQIKPYEIWPKK